MSIAAFIIHAQESSKQNFVNFRIKNGLVAR